MTDLKAVRLAVNAVLLVRRGELVMPEERLQKAITIIEQAATDSGRSVHDLLAGVDPDPRVCSREYKNRNDMLADLDERERYRAVRILHSLAGRLNGQLEQDPTVMFTLLEIAHDRAIVEG